MLQKTAVRRFDTKQIKKQSRQILVRLFQRCLNLPLINYLNATWR